MVPNPLALIAEITHRCPLHCVYCSNPLELTSRQEELVTADWLRVFKEAAALGVLHLHLTDDQRWGIQSRTHPEIVSPRALSTTQVKQILAVAARYQDFALSRPYA